MEVLGSPQGLLACIFRHKVQLLEAPDSSACASSLLFLIKWAVEPQIRSPQEATAALTAVSIILKQFREPSTDGVSRSFPDRHAAQCKSAFLDKSWSIVRDLRLLHKLQLNP